MPSLFPGMDPYLEQAALWPLFQRTFIACLREALPDLPKEYQYRVCTREYNVQENHSEDYIEVLRRNDDQLITLLDVVSPSNKTTAAGREAYLNTRRQARTAAANLVEIDLILQGQPMLDYAREGLPEWDYAVTVTRSTQPERYEIYTANLQKRLPRFRLPLASTDRDIVVNLQAAFDRCYDQCDFARRINYQYAPAHLHGRIATAAYYLWQQEGCPHGRDKSHWSTAVEQLQGQTTRPSDRCT
ncbi:MAG: DUF4058 family protein [Planctomycetes bacterium]|nr:DUF4058 family protein [Planctomycetota bacterium]